MSLIGDFGLARDLVNEEFYLKQTKGLVNKIHEQVALV